MAGGIETAMPFAEESVLLAIGRAGLEVAAGNFQVGEERQFGARALNWDWRIPGFLRHHVGCQAVVQQLLQ
ncbi:hypothetical protein D3C75_1253950 [compost metagenome]